MSIEKMQNLIKDAPNCALWWTENKTRCRLWSWFGHIVGVPLSLGIVLSVWAGAILGIGSALGATYNGSLGVSDVPLGVLSLKFFYVALGLSVPFALLCIYCPKKFQWKSGKCNEEFFKPSAQRKAQILSQILKLKNSQLPEIVSELPNIKDLDLPKAWWNMLEHAINNEAKAAAQVKDEDKCSRVQKPSDLEVLDNVYVEIEQLAQNQNKQTAKVFKI